MQKTGIEWATMTWNPVTGCLNNCQYCYARKIANRFESSLETFQKKMISSEYVGKNNECYQGEYHCPFPFGFEPTFYKERLIEPQHVKNPQRIFVCSMADLFGPWVPDEWIIYIFDACKASPQHKYMFLTKFPERYVELAKVRLLPKLDNFWYGQSISNGTAKAFFGQYHQFVSAEPLFGVVDPWGFDLVIIGAETGNRKDKIIPSEGTIGLTKYHSRCPVFMKDSLIPIIGESKMIRQLPEELLLPGEENV